MPMTYAIAKGYANASDSGGGSGSGSSSGSGSGMMQMVKAFHGGRKARRHTAPD